MDSYRELMNSHRNLSCLEDAVKNQRSNLLAAHRPKTGINTAWLTARASWAGLTDALNKEMARFNEIVVSLDESYQTVVKTEMESQQCVNDELRDDTLPNSECEVQEELYKDSVTVSEYSSIHSIEDEEVKHIEIENEDNKQDNINNMQTKCENPRQFEEDKETVKTAKKSRRQRRRANDSGPTPQNIQATPTWNKGSKQTKAKVVHCGYKYEGNGFSVYKGRPIYSITTLFCRKTFGFDESKVRAFLTKKGGFKKVGQIEFIDGQFNNYCLVKVRGPIKTIKNKLDTLNGDDGKVVHIYERRQTISTRKASRSLFVQNFDILNRMSHQKMTCLFARFGELSKDIAMKTDKFGNPVAVVHFENINDAISCYQGSKVDDDGIFVFDGKVLDVSFNKF